MEKSRGWLGNTNTVHCGCHDFRGWSPQAEAALHLFALFSPTLPQPLTRDQRNHPKHAVQHKHPELLQVHPSAPKLLFFNSSPDNTLIFRISLSHRAQATDQGCNKPPPTAPLTPFSGQPGLRVAPEGGAHRGAARPSPGPAVLQHRPGSASRAPATRSAPRQQSAGAGRAADRKSVV